VNEQREIKIDLRKVFSMLKKRILYIILGTLITAVLAGCITEFFITPTYTASCTLYVYSNTDRVSTDSSIGQNEITASQQLVNTYIVVLESDRVLEEVVQNLDLDMTVSQLRSMISCAQINETEIFNVTVTSASPALAADIANSIADVAPDAIVDTIKAGGVSVIDYAKVPSSPSSPDFKLNILIGALVGLVVTFLIFFIRELFDTTVTEEADLEREFENIPVIGTIPRLIPSAAKVEESPGGENKPRTEIGKGGRK
jgi:capsular polysaccharide biosynthesis protein